MSYKVYVKGLGLKNVPYEQGWQLYEKSEKLADAEYIFNLLEEAHGENVVLLEPGETIEDALDMLDGIPCDEYDISGNAPCDTYGPAACSIHCPQYMQCYYGSEKKEV